MSKLQYVRNQLKIINKVNRTTLSYKMSHIDEVIAATNATNDLKNFLREQVFINSVVNKEKKIKVFLKNILKTSIDTDGYSSSKYYPVFLLTKCPRGVTTTLSRLLVNVDLYTYNSESKRFDYNQQNPIGYENYGLVVAYNTRIDKVNGGTFFMTKLDKGKYIDAGTDYKTYTNPKLNLTMYMGVELEVARKHNTPKSICKDVLKDLNKDFNFDKMNYSFALLKSDGSIPTHGFEIVSAPATLKYHHTAWDKFFDNSAKHIRGFTVPSCGMHVHVSKLGFDGNLHIGKLLNFYNQPYNRVFITDIAGRTENSYGKFALKKLTHVSGNEFDEGKYQAVNLKNTATIEIRIFKSNVKKEGFFKNLEFVHASVEFTRQASICYKSSKEVTTVISVSNKARPSTGNAAKSVTGLTYKEFLSWVEKPENISTYPYLTKWLKARKYLDTNTIKLTEEKTNDKQFTYDQFLNDVA